MTRRWANLAFLAVLLGSTLGSCAGPRQAERPAVDATAIREQIDSLTRAFGPLVAARDTAAMMDYYAADAQMLPPNAPRAQGRDAIAATWREYLAIPDMSLALTTGDVMVAEAGDLVVETGSYHFGFRGPTGPVIDTGKYVTVWKMDAGRWKIVVDTFNSDLPVTSPS